MPQVEPALVAAGHFVADEQSQEVCVSHFGLDGLTVSGFEGMEDAGQPQLPEQVGEVGFRVSCWYAPVEWMDEGAETAAAVSVPDEFAGVPAESTLAGVAIGEGNRSRIRRRVRHRVLFQYGLDGAVLRIVVVQGTPAGGLETLGAVFPDQAQYPLHLAEVVHDVVIEQELDQGMAGTADFPCLRPAPCGRAPLVSECVGW